MLRHLVGLLAGIALTPVLWIAVAWSSGLLPRITEGDVTVASVASVVVMCLVGIVGAYLASGHVSPLFAASSGALVTALALWPVTAPASLDAVLGWLDPESFLYPGGAGTAAALPLGVLLLCSAMTPTRWRALREAPARVVASTSRDDVRRAGADGVRWDGAAERAGDASSAVTETIEDELPDTPPCPSRLRAAVTAVTRTRPPRRSADAATAEPCGRRWTWTPRSSGRPTTAADAVPHRPRADTRCVPPTPPR
ncbi:YIP1 family protein [Nocardiopsis sp. CNR-923]|uniref:YIP1 family protein n=1 Tax=Nocardiopsis sp. CNR-923 TaxID=1904965 RepID=UPI0021CD01C1|nr:YIP1 family protein [Nocardiopsis sp. CNR-923]